MSETGMNSAKLLEVLRLSKEVFLSDEKFLRELDAIILKVENGQTVFRDQFLGVIEKMKSQYIDTFPNMNDGNVDDFLTMMGLILEMYRVIGIDWLENLRNKKWFLSQKPLTPEISSPGFLFYLNMI